MVAALVMSHVGSALAVNMKKKWLKKVIATATCSNQNKVFKQKSNTLKKDYILAFKGVFLYIKTTKTKLVSKGKKMKTLLFASQNKSKIYDIQLYLGDKFQLKTALDFLDLNIKINEGYSSLKENALLKASTYAKATNLVTIADDTGFFINELGGEPGVAAKRWAGELPENATSEMFWEYLKQKTAHLEKITCYFEQCFAITHPNGKHTFVSKFTHGFLHKDKLLEPYNQTDYPLAQAFNVKDRNCTWDEITDEMKKQFDKPLINNLLNAISFVSKK